MKQKTANGLAPRPVRSLIYLPILRFGLTDQDWMFVLIGGVIGYTIPYVLGLSLWGIPLEIVCSALFVILSVLIMNILRVKKRPLYLKHLINSKFQGKNLRRRRSDELTKDFVLSSTPR